MTEPISVEAPSEAAAQLLARSLGARFRLEVSQVDGAWVVVVRPSSSGYQVGDVLEEVERWLVAADVTATRVHLDGHVYGLERRRLAEA